MSAKFTKVNRLEDFAKNVSQKASQGPISNPDLKKELREHYMEFIMKYKPYRASRAQFFVWITEALLEEITRIEMLKLNQDIKPTPPIWGVGRKPVGQKAIELRRMNEEMIVAKFGSMQSMAR
ncbi:hypothetical protein Hanom_Chr01g00055001 [Helianthus anomalus]